MKLPLFKDLYGRCVFITGASSGIGEGLARQFAMRGADLVIAARRSDRLQSIAEEIRRSNQRRVVVCECDVTRDGDLEKAVATGIQQIGKIDISIANAGFGVAGRIEKLSLDDYRRQFETNLFGVLRTIQATLPQLKKNQGQLVLIGSVAGYVALAGSSPYFMSKFAIHALASSMDFELRPQGVGVTLIVPGFVDSEIRQVDNEGKVRPATPDPIPGWARMRTDVASRHIVRAIARRKREAVITGHGKIIVWVQRHIPWAFRILVSLTGVRGRPEPRDSG